MLTENSLKYLLQGSLLIAGLLCFRTAFFLYESQEKEIQNKLEGWWIRVSDYRDASLSRHSAFMRRVARLTTILLDKIFGSKAFSLRAAWSLAFFAYSSVLIVGSFAFIYDSDWIGILYLLLAVPILALAVLPVLIRNESWFKWGCLGIGILYILPILISALWQENFTDILKLSIGVTIGLLLIPISYSLLIELFRWAIRRCAAFTSFLRIIFTIIILLMLVIASVKLPWWLSDLIERIRNPDTDLFAMTLPDMVAFALQMLAMGNLAAALPLSLFVLLAVLLACHQILWEFVDKPLYATHRFSVITNRKLLISLGVFLITCAGIPPFDQYNNKYN